MMRPKERGRWGIAANHNVGLPGALTGKRPREPSGRSPSPFGFGIITRRTGSGRYVFEISSSRRPPNHPSSPFASIATKVIPSTLSAPACGPAHRHGAECPLDESCRRADRSGTQAPPSPYDTAGCETRPCDCRAGTVSAITPNNEPFGGSSTRRVSSLTTMQSTLSC
jgi:hypothetical protein